MALSIADPTPAAQHLNSYRIQIYRTSTYYNNRCIDEYFIPDGILISEFLNAVVMWYQWCNDQWPSGYRVEQLWMYGMKPDLQKNFKQQFAANDWVMKWDGQFIFRPALKSLTFIDDKGIEREVKNDITDQHVRDLDRWLWEKAKKSI